MYLRRKRADEQRFWSSERGFLSKNANHYQFLSDSSLDICLWIKVLLREYQRWRPLGRRRGRVTVGEDIIQEREPWAMGAREETQRAKCQQWQACSLIYFRGSIALAPPRRNEEPRKKNGKTGTRRSQNRAQPQAAGARAGATPLRPVASAMATWKWQWRKLNFSAASCCFALSLSLSPPGYRDPATEAAFPLPTQTPQLVPL
jgi:hypothetical protein